MAAHEHDHGHDEETELRLIENLVARARDSVSPVAQRIAALHDLAPVLRASSRSGISSATTDKMIELKVHEWSWQEVIEDIAAFLASGDLTGRAGLSDLAGFVEWTIARLDALMALYDGWSSHNHPEHRHRWHDIVYSTIPAAMKNSAGLLKAYGTDAASAAAVSGRAVGLVAAFDEQEREYGHLVLAACFGAFAGFGPKIVDAVSKRGAFEKAAQALREDLLDSGSTYMKMVVVYPMVTTCMADAALTARLFASGIIEAAVVFVQRAQIAATPVHVGITRTIGQFVAGVATFAEGRAKLLATPGLEDALVWLLENGGDPVGIAEKKTMVDPCGMAGLSLALLRGREEDAQQALSAKVVQQIVLLLGTYISFGMPAYALPYVQGLAELSVSDANKVHLQKTPELIDHLVLGLQTHESDPGGCERLRTLTCSILAQLVASELTLPLLLGHPIIECLEKVPTQPESSKAARNDAMAVLFSVRLHEKSVAAPAPGAVSAAPTAGSAQHVMLSYEWSVQPTIKRIRDSLAKRGYRVWL